MFINDNERLNMTLTTDRVNSDTQHDHRRYSRDSTAIAIESKKAVLMVLKRHEPCGSCGVIGGIRLYLYGWEACIGRETHPNRGAAVPA
jgi:hypothetical protein